MKILNRKNVCFSKVFLFPCIFVLGLIFVWVLPLFIKVTFANVDYPVPDAPRTPYVQELYDMLVGQGYGSDSSGAWGDYGAVWNRIRSASLEDPTSGHGLWVDGQQHDMFRSQAYTLYPDFTILSDSSHFKNFASSWKQVYDGVGGEIWYDYRTDLYWSDTVATDTTNEFEIDNCSFFDNTNRGDYGGGESECGDAINACATLSLGGRTDWYLPTQAELLQAYLNGIYIETDTDFVGNDFFWSSTEAGRNENRSWPVNLSEGTDVVVDEGMFMKEDPLSVRCVARDKPLPGMVDQGGGYAYQSLMQWDDNKAFESGYGHINFPASSHWQQESSDPEIWRDQRTGLAWSELFDNELWGDPWYYSNDFDVDLCPFFDFPRGGYEYADYDPMDWNPNDCGEAIDYCAHMNTINGGSGLGGRKGWYLPSFDEVIQAYLHGMHFHTGTDFTGRSLDHSTGYWTATIYEHDRKYIVSVGDVWFYHTQHTAVGYARCVTRE